MSPAADPVVRPTLLAKRCPACGSDAVFRRPSVGFLAAFECGNCHAQLRVAFTWRVLWALPALAISCGAMYLGATWLKEQGYSGSALLSGFIGGMAGLSFGVSTKVALRGLIYKTESLQGVR